MAAKIESTDRQSWLEAALAAEGKECNAPSGAATGSEDKLKQHLSAILENLQHVGLQPGPLEQDEPVERDDLRSGIMSNPDHEASERKAIYDRLVAIENELKKRGSRRFGRYLVAVLIGVAATLAWQSYGDATKQIIATRAPDLGWSPEAKQMIASSIQGLGWTKPPAVESKAAPVPQNAPETVTPSFDPAQVRN
jgi:hypothetical protein